MSVYLPYEWIDHELLDRFGKQLSEDQICAARRALSEEYCELNRRRLLEEAHKLDAASAPGNVVYFAQDGVTSEIKIGTSGKIKARLKSLGKSIALLATVPGAFRVESWMHLRFGKARTRGEWFRPIPELISFAQTLDLGPVPRATYLSLPPLPLAVFTDEERTALSKHSPNLFSLLNGDIRAHEYVRRRACAELAGILRSS